MRILRFPLNLLTNRFPDMVFPHEYIALLLSEVVFPHGFIAFSLLIFSRLPLGRFGGVLGCVLDVSGVHWAAFGPPWISFGEP